MPKQVKITHVSDTHNLADQLDMPGGDLLIHTGDMTDHGTISEWEQFVWWLRQMSCRYDAIAIILGNHELYWDRYETDVRDLIRDELGDFPIQLTTHGPLDACGLKIWGSSWLPECGWAFGDREEGLALRYAEIPSGLDLLMTHCPPAGILDRCMTHEQRWDGRMIHREQSLGSRALREALDRIRPKVHCFGHIHPAYGSCFIDGMTFYNAAIGFPPPGIFTDPITFTMEGSGEGCE